MTDQPQRPRKDDWRLEYASTLAADWVSPNTGTKFEKGTTIHLSCEVKFNGKLLFFPLPSTSALFLNYSNKLFEETATYLKSSFYRIPNPKTPNLHSITDESSFYDFLEKRMASVVFAYTAIETFVNGVIPNNYIFKSLRKDGKCTEHYNKDQIEKNLSLDVKLIDILCPIKNKTGLKKMGLWHEYTLLKQLRDRIIHLKSNDVKSAKAEENTLITELMGKTKNYAITAKNLIEFFCEPDKPLWLKNIPF